MSDDKPSIAHLLRRTGFGPHPGQVETLLPLGYEGALAQVLAAPALRPEPPAFGTKDDERVLVTWWLTVMGDPAAGLHEKMVWFWHGHLTSSLDKAEPVTMWRQHQLLRTHALGNLRDMLQVVTVDAAMLGWLDGDGSQADAPNENYARELMELFTLGRDSGAYTEADVRAGAKALAGFVVDGDQGGKVSFDAEHALTGTMPFLGRSVGAAKDVIDAVCDHPACARFIAAKVYRWFHGVDADAVTLDRLAGGFRTSGLEIRPLVEAVLRDPSFVEHRLNRPRLPVEWFTAAAAALDVSSDGHGVDHDVLDTLGQVPFNPPNVAGWPMSGRWLSAGAALAKAQFAWDLAGDTETTKADDPVAWVLAKAGLFEVSQTTRDAIARAVAAVDGRREKATVLHALVVTCPEFALA
jgi:uncharacterized protein (DUF1800 family)